MQTETTYRKRPRKKKPARLGDLGEYLAQSHAQAAARAIQYRVNRKDLRTAKYVLELRFASHTATNRCRRRSGRRPEVGGLKSEVGGQRSEESQRNVPA